MSFRLACSRSKGRALVMSSGTVDTIRCHPLRFFFLPECSRQHWKGKWKKKVLALARSRCSIEDRAEPGGINKICAPRCCVGADWSKPSRVGNFLPPRVYASMAPCDSREAGSVHRNGVLMRTLWKPVTCSHMKQAFMNFYLGGRLVQLSVCYISVYICAAWDLLLV